MSELVEGHAGDTSSEGQARIEATDAPVESGETPAIRIRHLWHRFGDRDVLRDVGFDVGRGEIFGFIGPNGAGKTTTIRIIATLLAPMSGRVEVEGVDVAIDPERVRRLVGYMPDHAGVYDRLTAREYLEFFAAAQRVDDPAVLEAVVELTGLSDLQHRMVSEMSKGMKQRLQLARVLVHDPSVLVLDEPASDLDPRARIELRDLLLELRDLGKTVLLSSHILSELSDVCTSVAILERGRLVVAGPIRELADRLRAASGGSDAVAPWGPAAQPAELVPGGALPVGSTELGAPPAGAESAGAQPAWTAAGVPLPAAARKRLRIRALCDSRVVCQHLAGASGILALEPLPNGTVHVFYVGGDQYVAELVRFLVGVGIPVVSVEPERNELEQIFMQVTQGELQ